MKFVKEDLVNENISQTHNVKETLNELIGYIRSFVYPNLSRDEKIEFQRGLQDWIEQTS